MGVLGILKDSFISQKKPVNKEVRATDIFRSYAIQRLVFSPMRSINLTIVSTIQR